MKKIKYLSLSASGDTLWLFSNFVVRLLLCLFIFWRFNNSNRFRFFTAFASSLHWLHCLFLWWRLFIHFFNFLVFASCFFNFNFHFSNRLFAMFGIRFDWSSNNNSCFFIFSLAFRSRLFNWFRCFLLLSNNCSFNRGSNNNRCFFRFLCLNWSTLFRWSTFH